MTREPLIRSSPTNARMKYTPRGYLDAAVTPAIPHGLVIARSLHIAHELPYQLAGHIVDPDVHPLAGPAVDGVGDTSGAIERVRCQRVQRQLTDRQVVRDLVLGEGMYCREVPISGCVVDEHESH
jgi:hypothetical protein